MPLRLPLSEQVYQGARHQLVDFLSTSSGRQLLAEAGSFVAMSDGGMGSFTVGPSAPPDERVVCEFMYRDTDGMGVSVAALAPDYSPITSVDFWRWDFKAIKSFPEIADLVPLSAQDDTQNEN